MILRGWPDTCVQHEPGLMRNTLAKEKEGGQEANLSTHYAFTFVLCTIKQNPLAAVRDTICLVGNVMSDFKYSS